jgi:transglutaminase-like putative cysteine protease
VTTPLEEVWEKRRGVCQDFAHLATACMRSLGLPARYVSGYLRTHPPEGKERLVGVDASHAWFSVYCPDVGWVDFDPTNNILTAEEHITVAFGRDYADVSPVKGVITGGGDHEVRVSVDVEAVGEGDPKRVPPQSQPQAQAQQQQQ